MTPTRRGFLGALTGLASAMILDPERLIWTSGKKHISIPSPSLLSESEVIALVNAKLMEWFPNKSMAAVGYVPVVKDTSTLNGDMPEWAHGILMPADETHPGYFIESERRSNYSAACLDSGFLGGIFS